MLNRFNYPGIKLGFQHMHGRHKSLGKQVKQSVKWIQSIPSVKKVVLGFSECCRHKYPPGHLRFKKDVEGGIKINGYSGNGVTDMFVLIDPLSEREKVKTLLENRF